jgi:hypothetical protein
MLGVISSPASPIMELTKIHPHRAFTDHDPNIEYFSSFKGQVSGFFAGTGAV